MLAVASTTRVYLYMQAVDMRRSYDGLHAIVQSEFARDIRLGDYFMFINRRRDRIKIIWWDRDGLAIFLKRLESGSIQKSIARDADEGLRALSNGARRVVRIMGTTTSRFATFQSKSESVPSMAPWR